MMLILFLIVRRASNLVNDHQAIPHAEYDRGEKALAAQNDRLRRLPTMPGWRPRTPTRIFLRRIGQDLHDGPIQLVSLLMLKLTEPNGATTSRSERRSADDASVLGP